MSIEQTTSDPARAELEPVFTFTLGNDLKGKPFYDHVMKLVTRTGLMPEANLVHFSGDLGGRFMTGSTLVNLRIADESFAQHGMPAIEQAMHETGGRFDISRNVQTILRAAVTPEVDRYRGLHWIPPGMLAAYMTEGTGAPPVAWPGAPTEALPGVLPRGMLMHQVIEWKGGWRRFDIWNGGGGTGFYTDAEPIGLHTFGVGELVGRIARYVRSES